MLNAKKDERFSPNAKIRKVWIPKQYPVHRDDLAARKRVFMARERENSGRYPYHLKQESKKEKSFKGNDVSSKDRHTFPKGKSMNNP